MPHSNILGKGEVLTFTTIRRGSRRKKPFLGYFFSKPRIKSCVLKKGLSTQNVPFESPLFRRFGASPRVPYKCRCDLVNTKSAILSTPYFEPVIFSAFFAKTRYPKTEAAWGILTGNPTPQKSGDLKGTFWVDSPFFKTQDLLRGFAKKYPKNGSFRRLPRRVVVKVKTSPLPRMLG